ncbi:MAG: tyrosine--tRNA ligase [Candidatus Lloydbacteria bacterium CG22_combo_CG10-13_8_21_14_all_47_15]|uniref:Tyrosine--tRNA ligase n=1 Tax=Candidatus Lloydbacteria bacterium CG22_combo_CG10-13_8_21_14_all_47_15 TaxID=1974635 RepID=A0A2H0CUR3_9BACT|nr:MAG: tyrosine--tRNA ligase [Candidatus Lloydbacteria bacterium CG22_combo_CG10-13_8_21_14_all_47_15]
MQDEKIDEILSRSVDTIYPSKEALKEVLLSGKKLRVYVGIDPTSDYVHLGHSTNYILLKRFHELGHTVIVLVGDFTATIGDPSDKSAVRIQLTEDDVRKNLETFKEQIGKVIDFYDEKNPVEFRFNSDWLAVLDLKKLTDIASSFTVQRMIERDVFRRRMKEGKPLYVHEFFYPLMQGYDSVALDADLEIGGTDQTFNMLAGRDLVKKYLNKEKFVITTTLLENPKTGEKLMSKSLDTGISLKSVPEDMYGRVMALPDETIVQCFIDCTTVPMADVEEIKKELAEGGNPRDIKMQLARNIVLMYHGEDMANKAEEYFIKTFSRKETPEHMQEIRVPVGVLVGDALVSAKIIPSKSEWRRLVEGGGVHNLSNGSTITDINTAETKKPLEIKIGKRTFVRILPSDGK